jgi:hypothetical protein
VWLEERDAVLVKKVGGFARVLLGGCSECA